MVAEGLRTLLIPIMKLEGDDALQWPLEEKCTRVAPGIKSKRISAFHILTQEKFQNWHKELDPERLKRRYFLGWSQCTIIRTGTIKTPLGKSSGATNCHSTGRKKTYNLSIGTSGMGAFGFMPGISLAPSSSPSRKLHDKSKDLDDTVQDATIHQVIIYDAVDGTGWLLPRSCIIMHILSCIYFMPKHILEIIPSYLQGI